MKGPNLVKVKWILEALMINLLILKVVKCNSDSCPVSRQTMEIVPNCPTSESEWNEASQRKNCSAFASQCSYPDRLVYHCVINPFVNQTLEVCAYGKYIVLGYCTEYSYSGNIIQQNYDTDCSKFTQNPCPSGYHSTEAYKYPGCYELTKKSTVQNPTTAPSIPTSDTYVPTQNVSTFEESDMENVKDMNLELIIGITLLIGVLLVAGTAVVIFLLKRRQAKSKEQNLTEKETEGENGQLMNENGKGDSRESGEQKMQPVDGNKDSTEERLMQIEP